MLIGVSGSGKSTFAAQALPAHRGDLQRLLPRPGGRRRERPGGDAGRVRPAALRRGQAAGRRAADRRRRHQRAAGGAQKLVALAREHDVLPVAIVLDVPETRVRATATRPARTGISAPHVIRRQRDQLRRGAARPGSGRASARCTCCAAWRRSPAVAITSDAAVQRPARRARAVRRRSATCTAAAPNSRRCCGELGYEIDRDDAGRPVDARHPDGRRAVFVGDLVDRGPDTPGVLRLVMGMVAAGNALCVPGNHEDKLVRALRGRNVKVSHGLAESLAQLAAEPAEFRAAVQGFRGRPDQPLRARRRPAGGRARRADRVATTAGRPAGCAASRCTATPPGRPTSTGCRCATRGPTTTAAGRWCSTATPRCPTRSGSTAPCAWTPAACSAAG